MLIVEFSVMLVPTQRVYVTVTFLISESLPWFKRECWSSSKSTVKFNETSAYKI